MNWRFATLAKAEDRNRGYRLTPDQDEHSIEDLDMIPRKDLCTNQIDMARLLQDVMDADKEQGKFVCRTGFRGHLHDLWLRIRYGRGNVDEQSSP